MWGGAGGGFPYCTLHQIRITPPTRLCSGDVMSVKGKKRSNVERNGHDERSCAAEHIEMPSRKTEAIVPSVSVLKPDPGSRLPFVLQTE